LKWPSDQEVGFIINLDCGHTARPNDVETLMFQIHLEKAGFIKEAPQRQIQIKTKVVRPEVPEKIAPASEIIQMEQEDKPQVLKPEEIASNFDDINAAQTDLNSANHEV